MHEPESDQKHQNRKTPQTASEQPPRAQTLVIRTRRGEIDPCLSPGMCRPKSKNAQNLIFFPTKSASLLKDRITQTNPCLQPHNSLLHCLLQSALLWSRAGILPIHQSRLGPCESAGSTMEQPASLSSRKPGVHKHDKNRTKMG